MQVPASIQEILDTQKVSYSVTENSTPSNMKVVNSGTAQCLVKSLLVRDSKGLAQVLLPSDHILDIDAMFRQFGRKFESVPPAQARSLVEQERLDSIPAIPNWQGMATFIDNSLLKKDELTLESGNHGQTLQMSRDDFGTIISSAKVGTFTSKAPKLSTDRSDDVDMITQSVQHFTELRIKQRLDETLELPPLPETAQRIIKLRADPNADINDLTNIVEIDPSLSAQVVSWAASPYYSAPGKIKSVHDAIVRVLGFDMVLNLALGLALGKTLTMKALNQQQINAYWRSSVYNAAAVEGLVTSISREHRPGFGMSYLSGLLNNFGYLIIGEIFPPYFNNITRLANCNPHLNNAVIEQHLLGVTGNQVSSWLLENWNMPEEVVVALRQQNNPRYDGEYNVYAKLLYVAKQMLADAGFDESFGEPISEKMLLDLHLDPKTAEVTIANILEAGSDLDEIAEKMRG